MASNGAADLYLLANFAVPVASDSTLPSTLCSRRIPSLQHQIKDRTSYKPRRSPRFASQVHYTQPYHAESWDKRTDTSQIPFPQAGSSGSRSGDRATCFQNHVYSYLHQSPSCPCQNRRQNRARRVLDISEGNSRDCSELELELPEGIGARQETLAAVRRERESSLDPKAAQDDGIGG
jgi:hypothetical protein